MLLLSLHLSKSIPGRFAIACILLFAMSCKRSPKEQTSYWNSQVNRFKYQHKTEFVMDSSLEAEYKNLPSVKLPLFDSLFDAGPVYLYSWQESGPTKNAFTVIADDEDHGRKIAYLVFDKKDSLLSVTYLANLSFETYYRFETRSKFQSKDTLLYVAAVTKFVDDITRQKMEKPVGDTSILYKFFDGNGKVTEKRLAEKNRLHYKNE